MAMKWRGLLGGSESQADDERVVKASDLDLDPSNSEIRHQVAIVADCSGSMSRSIDTINEALAHLVADVDADAFLRKALEFAIIRVAGDAPSLVQPFAPVDAIELPRLSAGGGTPLYRGIVLAAE